MTEAPTAAERTRQRRFITAVLVGVIVVGVVGMLAAFLITDDGDSPTSFSTPGASFDPLSVAGKCRSEGVVRFEVTPDPAAAAEFTATGAVEKWVEKGETSQTTNTGDDSKLVAIGKDGKLPRVVLTVERKDAAWVVTETAGCLEKGDPRACPTETLTVGKKTYARDEQVDPPATEPRGDHLGNGALTFTKAAANDLVACTHSGEPRLQARGTIAPVSAFAAEGKNNVLVTDDQTTRLYTR